MLQQLSLRPSHRTQRKLTTTFATRIATNNRVISLLPESHRNSNYNTKSFPYKRTLILPKRFFTFACFARIALGLVTQNAPSQDEIYCTFEYIENSGQRLVIVNGSVREFDPLLRHLNGELSELVKVLLWKVQDIIVKAPACFIITS